jgi:hypothetical protein
MHAIKEKPVVVNGQIVIRPIMVVALTYDHRLLDGREAVTFLGTPASVRVPRCASFAHDAHSQGARLHRGPGEDAARMSRQHAGRRVVGLLVCFVTRVLSVAIFVSIMHVDSSCTIRGCPWIR